MTKFAHDLISLVRKGKPTRDDILTLCNELEARLGEKPKSPPPLPHPELRRLNPKQYMRLYMRHRRWAGQPGEGRKELA